MSQKSYLSNLIEELEKAILLAHKMEESGKQPAIEQAILLEKLRNAYNLVLFQDEKTDTEPHVYKADTSDSAESRASHSFAEKPTTFTSNEVVKNTPVTTTVEKPKEQQQEHVNPPVQEKKVIKPSAKVNPVPPTKKEEKSTETLGETLRAGKRFLNEYLAENTDRQDLATRMQTKPIKDLSKAIGINDKFLFTRELFGGDSQQFQDTIHAINEMSTIEEALIYVGDNFDWQANDSTVIKLIELIQRRFIIQP